MGNCKYGVLAAMLFVSSCLASPVYTHNFTIQLEVHPGNDTEMYINTANKALQCNNCTFGSAANITQVFGKFPTSGSSHDVTSPPVVIIKGNFSYKKQNPQSQSASIFSLPVHFMPTAGGGSIASANINIQYTRAALSQGDLIQVSWGPVTVTQGTPSMFTLNVSPSGDQAPSTSPMTYQVNATCTSSAYCG